MKKWLFGVIVIALIVTYYLEGADFIITCLIIGAFVFAIFLNSGSKGGIDVKQIDNPKDLSKPQTGLTGFYED